LRIRSTRPLEADQPLNFPDLVPWGRGKFSMHTVALVVPTDRSPIVDFSGLEPADAATRLLFDRNLPAELPADSSRSVYSVRLKGWSLAVRPPSGSNDPDGGAPEARVSLADVSGVVAADGTVRGHVAFDLQPSNAPFLVLQAPPGAVCPAAVVDGLPALPRVPAEGRWAIPLGDGPSRRVELVWIDPGPEDARRAGRRFSIPQPIQDDSAVLITLSCDESHSLNASGGSILPTPAASPLVDRMERAADRIRAKLDPDPPASSAPVSGSVAVAVADRDALGAEVARLLSLQRQAERSAYWAAVMHPDTAEVVRQRGPLRRIATVRQEIEADLIAAGLPDLIASSSPADDPGPAPNRLAPPLPGIPHHFRAETEANRPITFEWTAEDPR
jgi:hypothetical protein